MIQEAKWLFRSSPAIGAQHLAVGHAGLDCRLACGLAGGEAKRQPSGRKAVGKVRAALVRRTAEPEEA